MEANATLGYRTIISHLQIFDYVVFSSMLILSAITGLYFGCRGRACSSIEKPTLKEYLTGNKNMNPFPVGMSLIAGYVSAITILGTPAEIYNFGTQYCTIVIPIWLSGIFVASVYLPVFYRLQVNSSYEYLEMRFNRKTRTLVSILYVMQMLLFLPIVLYVPSLAFNQVTGINMYLIGTVVTLICIFYTVLGGIDAIVWTGTWQMIIMLLSLLVVVVISTIKFGGIESIWNTALNGNRIIFLNFNTSMYERQSVFSVLIGGFFHWTCFNSVDQSTVQRYLSLASEKKSKWSVGIFTIGISFLVLVCCFSGLLVYASYYDCDPLTVGKIHSSDQILPLFVMETAGHISGLPGLFMAGIFGAALSSLDVALNSTSIVVLEDIVNGSLRMELTEKNASIFVKVVALMLGIHTLASIAIVEKLDGVLSVSAALTSIAAGTICGIFSLGMLVPWATTTGTLIGSVAGATFSGLVSFGIEIASASKRIIPHTLPVSVERCDVKYGLNITYTPTIFPNEDDVFPLFRLSYHWVTPIAFVTVLIVGTGFSFIFGKNDLKKLDPDLISPVVKVFLPKEAENVKGSAFRQVRQMISSE